MLTPEEVAEKHLTAVKGGDPFLMAEDYAQDALLVRGEDVFAGKEEIFNYFAGVPNRMGSEVIKFMKLEVDGASVSFFGKSLMTKVVSGKDVMIIKTV